MAKTTKPNYKKLYKKYQARRRMKRAGRVRKGDGLEVDHKVPISKGGSNKPANLRIVSRKTNRTKKDKMPRSKR